MHVFKKQPMPRNSNNNNTSKKQQTDPYFEYKQ